MEQKRIVITKDSSVAFHNQVDFCIGTGRMGLALQKEYLNQLKMVQEAIGFQHIRGHGLFCDDMAIYQEDKTGRVEYNYTYLDRVFDSYLELGLVPFLELGFMPGKMASGEQTVFYWKGNVTPPKVYDNWVKMVQGLLEHLCARYGREEVIKWPIEVWNEPNLPGFWKNADMEEYFHLFDVTFHGVKEVDTRFRVGGPAVCGGSDEKWIRAFLEYCSKRKIPVDFVTRHHYTTELPKEMGHYGYAKLQDPEGGFQNLHTTRDIIDSFPEYKNLEIHITEFNTSYIPNCPLHDTNQNAACIAKQLSRLGDDNESYSYWTFGDVFEERGVPFTPFHGGFGLVANGCIPKPTFWTFAFFKNLKGGTCVYRDDNTVIVRMQDHSFRGVIWKDTISRENKGLKEVLEFVLDNMDTKASENEFSLLVKTVDEQTCNPLKVWHDIGEPANPSAQEVKLLQQAANPFITSKRIPIVENKVTVEINVEENGVVYFEGRAIENHSDSGYDYDRVMAGEKE